MNRVLLELFLAIYAFLVSCTTGNVDNREVDVVNIAELNVISVYPTVISEQLHLARSYSTIFGDIISLKNLTVSYHLYEDIIQILDNEHIEKFEYFYIYNEFGMVAFKLDYIQIAINSLKTSITLNPNWIDSRCNLASIYNELGAYQDAIDQLQLANSISPDNHKILFNLASVIQPNNASDESFIQYLQRAVSIDPTFYEAWASIASYYSEICDEDSSNLHFNKALEAAQQRSQNDYVKVMIKKQFGSVCSSAVSTINLISSLDSVITSNCMDTTFSNPNQLLGPNALSYYSIYNVLMIVCCVDCDQGDDEYTVRTKMSEMFTTCVPSLAHTSSSTLATMGKVIKIGFASSFFFHHSVGLLLQDVISQFANEKFDVYLILIGQAKFDHITDEMMDNVNHVIKTKNDVQSAKSQIESLSLDILVYGEIGMHGTSYFLAHYRLATVQVLFWGHAVTSGIAGPFGGLDYFITSRLFEEDNHAEKTQSYTEELIAFESLSFGFRKPRIPNDMKYIEDQLRGIIVNLPKLKAKCNDNCDIDQLSSALTTIKPSSSSLWNIYIIPQTSYKISPAMDNVLSQILTRDPFGLIVLLEGSHQSAKVAKKIINRLSQSVKMHSRIRMLPELNSTWFAGLCSLGDVSLDPFPVGGGRTSLETFAVGTPIIVQETRTSVLQLTKGMYRSMMIGDDLVTLTDEEYIHQAVSIGRNKTKSREIRKLILSSNSVLYDSAPAVVEWQFHMERILRSPLPSSSPKLTLRSVWDVTDFGYTTRSSMMDEKEFRLASLIEPVFTDCIFAIEIARAESNEKSLIIVHKSSDPREICNNYASYFSLDFIQREYVCRVVSKGSCRIHQPSYANYTYNIDHDGQVVSQITVEIHYGDDVQLVVNWYAVLHSLQGAIADQLYNDLTIKLPETSSPNWLRALDNCNQINTVMQQQEEEEEELPTISLGFLGLSSNFRTLIQSLIDDDELSLFDEIVICDYHSSVTNRIDVMNTFPFFSFLYFNDDSKINAIKKLIQFVETDYLFLFHSNWNKLPNVDLSRAINRAVSVLKYSVVINESLIQIQLNDQGDRSCASGNEEQCPLASRGKSGWKREVNGTDVVYYRHEFGTCNKSHSMSFWPGFSLHPSLINVHEAQSVVHLINSSMIDLDPLWVMSVELQRLGKLTGFLPEVSFQFVGDDAS